MTSINIEKFPFQINVRNVNKPGFCCGWWKYKNTSTVLLSGLKKIEWISTVMSEFYVAKYLTSVQMKFKEIDLTKM